MFKRIVKVVGFVLLGFVLVIGGVVAFMAIRGDFKKQVIKPTAIDFSIDTTELLFDASITDKPTMANGRVHSFKISAQPENVTEIECVLKLDSPLITFVEYKDGEWKKYNSNKFYLNRPIYFVVNDVVGNAEGKDFLMSESEYDDGVLTITVKDSSGLLQDTLELEIDRAITSISLKDSNDENNQITNGLFAYEDGKGEGQVVQNLEFVESQDHVLEIITAPLKASKPFNLESAKIVELYYVELGQQKMIVNDGEVVKLQRYDDQGNKIEEDCEFLTYDTSTGNYVFNSTSSGKFEFLLATYPTYEIQERITSQEMSFIERLQSVEFDGKKSMITKSVVITVSGTEAERVSFEGNVETKIEMNLFKDNKWIVNDYTNIDPNIFDLGLTLSKASETEITGRYNELKFLDNADFDTRLVWNLRKTINVDDSNITSIDKKSIEYANALATIIFSRTVSGNTIAIVNGFDDENVVNGVEYNVFLNKISDMEYSMILLHGEQDVNNADQVKLTELSFRLKLDPVAGRVLNLDDGYTLDDNSLNNLILTGVDVSVYSMVIGSEYAEEVDSNSSYYNVELANCMILDEYNDENKTCKLKTLKEGIYLSILEQETQYSLQTLINDNFVISSIEPNGANSIISIKPIKEFAGYSINLYAIVVNSNGSWRYTETPRGITIKAEESNIVLSNDGKLDLPVIVGDSLDYTTDFDVEDLAGVVGNGSYTELLLFAPKYSLLTMSNQPKGWGYFDVYTKSGDIFTKVDGGAPAYEANKYYTLASYDMIDLISTTIDGETCYLVGYIENNRFVNKVVATRENYYTKLYPVLAKSEYLKDMGRLQTAEEYVDSLLNKTATIGDVTYDLTLYAGRTITKDGSKFVKVSEGFETNKQYYQFIGGSFTEVTPEDVNDGVNNYYKKVNVELAKVVLGDTADSANANLKYYTLRGDELVQTTTVIGDATFTSNWGNYYVIVTHYAIESKADNGTDITITACPYYNSIKLHKSVDFTISIAEYNTACAGKFVVGSTGNANTYITATSYYDFKNSTITPTSTFGGTYFDNPDAIKGDDYQIIAGHKSIKVDWDGFKNGGDEDESRIKNKTVKSFISINRNDADHIVGIIHESISVRAVEYNELGEFERDLQKELNPMLGLIRANIVYNPNFKYFIYNGGVYSPTEISADIINDWETLYLNYYVYGLYLDFEIDERLGDGHYIVFEWKYLPNDYVIESSRLMVQSRELKGYNIIPTLKQNNVDDIDTTIYKPVLITEASYDGDYYKYEAGKYVEATETYEYEASKYYKLEVISPTETIGYKIEISYDSGDYEYNVYPVDGADNKLLYLDRTEYIEFKASPELAFKLREHGGWIKPYPAYAMATLFTIIDNEYLQFTYSDDEDTGREFSITSAKSQADDKFVGLVLQSQDASIATTINVKVVDDGKFNWNGVTTTTSSTKQLLIDGGIYTYGGTHIGNLLIPTIKDDFTIINLGQNVESKYEVKGLQIVEKANNNNVIAKLESDDDGDGWKLTRTSYDKMAITIEFQSVLGIETITFDFKNPYEVTNSQTNNTTTVYLGTKFNIAATTDAANIEDPMYKINLTEGNEGNIVIRYSLDNGVTYTVFGAAGDIWTLDLTDDTNHGDLIELIQTQGATNIEFEMCYGMNNVYERIGIIPLTIAPNQIITADVSKLIKRDDLNNNEYNLLDLNISSYNNGSYESYKDASKLVEIGNLENISCDITTFTDAEFANKYSTNIMRYDEADTKFVVDQISRLGTYYVKVDIYTELIAGCRIKIGEVKFEIESKSQVTNKNNAEIDDIVITAKTEKEYGLTELQTLFNLSRGGDAYTKVSSWQQDITYKKLADGTFVVMDTDEGNGYYQKTELTDMFWFNTNNQYLEIVYTYAGSALTQSVEYKYTEYAGEWEVGKSYYYINNSEYVLAETKQSNVTYYTLEIIQKLTYNGKTYKLLGTTYNMDNYAYDMVDDCLVNGAGNKLPTQMFGNNIAYYMINNQSVIYCKQNAYLFVDMADTNNILAMSIEGNGKTLYNFVGQVNNTNASGYFTQYNSWTGDFYQKVNGVYALVNKGTPTTDKYVINDTNVKRVELGNLQTLTFNYNDFGKNLPANVQYLDTIEYGVELVFNNINIKTNELYTICVEPYTLTNNATVLLAESNYTLLGASTGIFSKDDSKVESVTFGSGADYTITNQTSINFDAQGNNYITSIPVTIKYKNTDTTYTYNVDINIVNSKVVNIDYPYNVDKSYEEYNKFTASITEFGNSVDNLLTIEDFADWMGVDRSKTDWQSNNRVKYDLALRGDIINLAEQDNLNNISRFKVYEYIPVSSFTAGTYYKYNKNTTKFEGAEYASQPTDWNGFNYFTRIMVVNPTITNMEVVATSSTYSSLDDEIIKGWFADSALQRGEVRIKEASLNVADETLTLAGYVVFKVYAGSAYGYYVLKISPDDRLENVIEPGVRRQTLNKSKTPTDAGISLQDFINDNKADIAIKVGIGAEYIHVNSTYLFVVDNKISSEMTGETVHIKDISSNEYIPMNIKLPKVSKIEEITMAVVISYGTSMVHICNINLVLKPNVDVTVNNADIEVLDGDRYVYSLKDDDDGDEKYCYDYVNGGNNTKNIETFFNLIPSKTLDSVTFVTEDNDSLPEAPYSNLFTVDENNVKYGSDIIAYINADKQLVLSADVTEDAYYYLALTYNDGFVIYLRILLAPFDFTSATHFEVGGSADSTNMLYLRDVFGKYKGSYTIDQLPVGAKRDNDPSKGDYIQFPASNIEYSATLTIKLTNVYPNIEKTISVKVKPNIEHKYNGSWEGYSPTGVRVTPDMVDYSSGVLTATGSTLAVDISGNIITIKGNSSDYFTITAQTFSAIEFTLTDDKGDVIKQPNGEAYQYFVGADKVTATATTTLNFVHSAQAVNLRLNMVVYMEAGKPYSTTYVLYITLPQTYSLNAEYRVTDAGFETVVNNTTLMLKSTSSTEDLNANGIVDEKEISKHLLGTESEIISSFNKISRFSITASGKKFWGYDQFANLGLLEDKNPNKLNFALNNGIDINNTSSIDNGILVFRSVNNDANSTLTISNTTTSLDYKFKIYHEEYDYSHITYNQGLLLVDNNPNDNVVTLDYIALKYSDFNNPVELAYLQYLPNENIGQPAYVYMDMGGANVPLVYNVAQVSSAQNYSSKILLINNGLEENEVYSIDIYIISLNGVASKTTLVISNLDIKYGYTQASESYEYVYGGTQMGKVTEKYDASNKRVNATIKLSSGTSEVDYEGSGSTYQFKYVTAINGHITQWALGDNLPISDLVGYSTTDGVVSLRQVAFNTNVTLVFNIVDGAGYVYGRIYYQLVVQNNLKIGINSDLAGSDTIDLYLGSQAYSTDGVNTTIDLLESEKYNKISSATQFNSIAEVYIQLGSVYIKCKTKPATFEADTYYYKTNVYNNIYITLERYSDGKTIANNKALYNGNLSTELFTNVANHLRFSIAETDDMLKGKVSVVSDTGKLSIKGNPSGMFVLNVAAANETGYSENFKIQIHKYDNTTAQYDSRISNGTGSGYASGTTLNLFKDANLASNYEIDDYAFVTYRESYDKTTNKQLQILPEEDSDSVNPRISYQMLAFDEGTAISEIKNSTLWRNASANYLDKNNIVGDDGAYSIFAPRVKASTVSGVVSQIVTIRLTITYNKDDTNHYFAHYKVYNADTIKVNAKYSSNKTIVYGEGAWQSAKQLTLMDLGNTGLYAATTLLTSADKPTDWVPGTIDKYYSYNETTGQYDAVDCGVTPYNANTYYKLNDIAAKKDDYEFVIIRLLNNGVIDNKVYDSYKYLNSVNDQIAADLPDSLFTNEAEITIIVREKASGAHVIEDVWTITANNPITPYDSKPLSMFFLQSEIGKDLYQDYEIIGLGSDYLSFVRGASSASYADDICLSGNYYLHRVTYEGTGNSVFTIKQDYYVLVDISNTTTTAMSFAFNAGADYYINLTIDETNIDASGNAIIKLGNYVQVWNYDNNKFNSTTPSLSVTSGIETGKFEYSSGELTLYNIIDHRENIWKTITISDGTISRTIQIYFNIVINANEAYFDDTNNYIKHNEMLATALDNDSTPSELTNDEIGTALRKELLTLIEFNDKPVVNDGIVDMDILNRYTINVKYDSGSIYKITYVYSYNNATYKRTFDIYKHTIIIASGKADANGNLANNSNVNTAMTDKTNLSVTEDGLKNILLDLIRLNGVTPNADDFDISIVKHENYYSIQYGYEYETGKTYSVTFKMNFEVVT